MGRHRRADAGHDAHLPPPTADIRPVRGWLLTVHRTGSHRAVKAAQVASLGFGPGKSADPSVQRQGTS